MNINEFRDGIFALRTRRFGNVAEIMIEKIYKFENSNKLIMIDLMPLKTKRLK